MATPVARDNADNLRTLQDAVPDQVSPGANPPSSDEELAGRFAERLQREKVELYNLVKDMGNALFRFSDSVNAINNKIKNKELLSTSKSCTDALTCIKKTIQKSLYYDEKVINNIKRKNDAGWTNNYSKRHVQFYEQVSDCMKQHLNYTASNNQTLIDFRAICLGIKVDGETIITDDDALAIENVINLLNEIQNKKIETAIELLQIIKFSSSTTKFADTAYLAFWNNLWSILGVSASIAILLGIQSLEPQILARNHLRGKYFSAVINKRKMYWMFDPLTEAFQSVPVLPEYASIITCPDGVGFSFLNGLTANGISYQYACSAGNLIARIPLQKISSYIFHALSIPVNGILSHITNVQITPEHTIMGIAAAAAITGIAFKAGYYAYNKKRKREPDEVDESITDASAVSAELDNQASQSKRPRASRPTRAT
ncbi:hypothetical protein EXVG_00367 [Emiliania huxleyi virus 202]|nr:hypothetical protein EXVG_00367 [Emiliania huxleyi virus 202]AHA55312.1 putative membrane protein [Emiliania huxleyi virus 156]